MSDANPPPECFISCDWGTTNFRLRVVDTESLRILEELSDTRGIRLMNQHFLRSGQNDRAAYYLRYLNERIGRLAKVDGQAPVVASGMASSSIGLRELAYAELPLRIDGRGLYSEWLPMAGGRGLLLVSGVRQADGIMRGEEVQAVGLGDELRQYGAGTLILPGTHSKHMQFDGLRYTGFTTYLTGELFELLSTESVLAASVSPGERTAPATAAFREGVEEGGSGYLNRSLFGVRVRDVLGHRSAVENYYFLSGLLIGNEIADAADGAGAVYLAATQPTLDLYAMALELLLPDREVHTFDEGFLLRALLSGQQKLLLQNVR